MPATERAVDHAGLQLVWRKNSFNRIRRILEAGEQPICVTGHGRGSDSVGKMYLEPPVGHFGRSGLLVRKSDIHLYEQLASVEALFLRTTLVGGFVKDAKYAVDYEQYLPDSKTKHIMSVGTHEQLAQLVARKRIDFVFENELMVPVHEEMNLDGAPLAFVRLPGMPDARAAYIVCSKAVPADVIQRLEKGLRAVAE